MKILTELNSRAVQLRAGTVRIYKYLGMHQEAFVFAGKIHTHININRYHNILNVSRWRSGAAVDPLGRL